MAIFEKSGAVGVVYISVPFSFSLFFIPLLATSAVAAEWELVWSDEFQGKGHPDPSKWGYESGFVRNQEKQFYTTARLKNARLENGHLIIEGHQESLKSDQLPNEVSAKPARINYTSASLHTKGLADWKFGKIEVRAKVPKGKGTWPAIWTLGSNVAEVGWPRCGEIDLMEFVGKEPGKVHANAHFYRDDKHASDHKERQVDRVWETFHLYSIEWDATHIHFALDDTRYHSFRIAKADTPQGNPFHRPHYLILNLAIGGNWGGEIDPTIFPVRYLIDYVRVYQKQ